MLNLNIDDSALQELGARLGASEAQIIEARNRTIAALQKQVAQQVRRDAARAWDAPQRVFRSRLRTGSRTHHGPGEMQVWLGTMPLDPREYGTPREYGRRGTKFGGVRIGRRNWRGAWLMTAAQTASHANSPTWQGGSVGNSKIWIRLHSRHYTHSLYEKVGKPRKPLNRDHGRLPLRKAVVRMDKNAPIGPSPAELRDSFNILFKEFLKQTLGVAAQNARQALKAGKKLW